jgi:hypothetical protein
MGSTETPPTAARPAVHVHGGDALADRVAKLGWDVVRVDATAAESARTKGLALVADHAASLSDDKLAAAVSEAVVKQSVAQLSALRADAKKVTHDARNSVGLIWLHLAALERAATGGPSPQVAEAIEQIKEETRSIVALLDRLNTRG